MFDATAPGFDGPAGCPMQSRIRFRRLWLRFFVRRRKNKRRAPTPTRVPGRETCLSRLNVVNTEFQLRHLIIWSSIFIHATSESGETRAHETGFANTTERRTGVRTCGADGASDGIRLRPVFDPSFSKTRFRRFVSRVNSALVFVAGRKRRDARTVVRRSSEDQNRRDVAAATIGSIEREKKKRRRLEDLVVAQWVA